MSAIDFWRGKQGDQYIDRNSMDDDAFDNRCLMWQRIMANCYPNYPKTILEVGANVGRNLRALHCVSAAEFFAVEPNELAVRQLLARKIVMSHRAFVGKAQRLPLLDRAVDLAFTCGVLIHIPPDDLLGVCKEIHRVSRRWIVSVEYFSDHPEMIRYRGEDDRLWKRDFGSFWMDNFNLRPVHQGFEWKRTTGLDNLTWWVFEKL